MKKITCLLSCLVIMGCASGAFAWDEWSYAGGSHSWNNAANWDSGVPTAGLDPIMRDAGAGGYAEVGTGVAAVGGTMWMYGGGQADLNVNGGSLTLSQLRIGVDGDGKTVNVSAGSVHLNSDSTVGQGGAGVGYLNISGTGSFTNTGWEYLGNAGGIGHVNVTGGTASFNALRGNAGSMTISAGAVTVGSDMTVGEGGAFDLTMTGGSLDQTAGWMYVGHGSAGGVHLNGGILSSANVQLDGSAGEYFDIAGGTLRIKNNFTDGAFQANWYAGLGYITVNGGQNAVGKLNIVQEAGTGYALVTAVPEPMTMLLLGLGGLFIRRK